MDESVIKYLEQPALADWKRKLLAAADYIEKHGLSCGGQVDRFGRRCVVRVLNEFVSPLDKNADPATRDLERNGEAFDMLRFAIQPYGIGEWSDRTPADQVVAKLRAVALGGG